MSLIKREHVDEILTELKKGSILTKRKHNGEKYSRHFYLHDREHFISYHHSEKAFSQIPHYYIQNIDDIRSGFSSRTFDRLLRHKSIEQTDEDNAFSIFYNNYRDELHLVAEDKRTRDMWVQGLLYLTQTYAKRRQQHVINETNWIMNYFYLADKDGSGSLTKRECRRFLIDILNAKVSDDTFESVFQEADTNGEEHLTSDEFINFFHILIRRQDLYKIMQKYVKNGEDQSIETISMDVDELLYFLQTVQHQTIITYPPEQSKLDFTLQSVATHEQVRELIDEFEPNVELKKKGQLSLNGFRDLLLSEDFCIMKPWCFRYVYQDMKRPLSDYYIKTSHNTYLFNTQLTGDSNPEAYNRALRAGCRAVEIDCYDGDNGRPIVKHGFTLVKPCLFESVIRFMEPNLFKTSPYPVVLDLENHCSIEQQNEMARILRKILGDRLVAEPVLMDDTSVLPSPEDLKYKVLIRGVKIPPIIAIPKLLRTTNDDDEDEEDPNTLLNPHSKLKRGLADLFVYLQNVPFHLHDRTKEDDCVHSANIAEKHFDRAVRTDPMGLIKRSIKSSLRMYPDGLRQDSSNPNPIHPWNFGVQMVALNYQNNDPMMSLSYGKFLDNGGSGYVLKPKYLIDIDKTHFNPLDYTRRPSHLPETIVEYPQRLTITIISGQFLPRSSETTNDIPDPYVVVSTHGITCDQQSQKTQTIDNNGFDPTWNETFTFDIYFPQMCLVRFDVFDYDRFTRDDRLASFCLPMTTIQTGYRHVLLRAKNNNLTYASLFVHVNIESISNFSED